MSIRETQSRPVRRPPSRGSTAMMTEWIPQNQRRCVLCGQLYRSCKCKCTWCGAKKWVLQGDRWSHHVCGGKR